MEVDYNKEKVRELVESIVTPIVEEVLTQKFYQIIDVIIKHKELKGSKND